MIYHHGQIKELQIKAFDKEGEEIGVPLLIDTTTKTVWSHPIFLRDCPDPAKVFTDNPEDDQIWRKWGTQQSPVVFQYETLLKGCYEKDMDMWIARTIRAEHWLEKPGVEVL